MTRLVGVLVVACALAACGSPQPSETWPSPSTASSSASPSSQAGPPPEARKNTKAGAEAFALWYFNATMAAWRRGNPSTLERWSLSSCKQCSIVATKIRKNVAAEVRAVVFPSGAVLDTTVVRGKSAAFVVVRVKSPEFEFKDKAGKVTDSGKISETIGYDLAFANGSWKVARIS